MNSDLLGVVMCGGYSTRMGKDKFLIPYHNIPQWQYVYNQLTVVCNKVIISCRKDQAGIFDNDYETVPDELEGIGPVAGIVSVMNRYSQQAIMVIGCDYPMLQIDDLEQLAEQQTSTFDVTTYLDKNSMIVEPLIAVYQPVMKARLEQNIKEKQYSLQKIIKTANANFIIHYANQNLHSFDTLEQVKEYFLS